MNGTRPFHLKEFILLGSLGGQLRCFSAVLCLYSPLGKAFTIYVLTNSLHPYFKLGVPVPTLNLSSLAYKFYITFISCIQAAFGF